MALEQIILVLLHIHTNRVNDDIGMACGAAADDDDAGKSGIYHRTGNDAEAMKLLNQSLQENMRRVK